MQKSDMICSPSRLSIYSHRAQLPLSTSRQKNSDFSRQICRKKLNKRTKFVNSDSNLVSFSINCILTRLDRGPEATVY